MCQKYKLQIVLFRLLSTVVLTLYSCYIHSKDHAQCSLCESSVYSREIINMFLVSQVSGLVFGSDTTNVINVKLCFMILLTEFYLFTLTIFQVTAVFKSFSKKCCILI